MSTQDIINAIIEREHQGAATPLEVKAGCELVRLSSRVAELEQELRDAAEYRRIEQDAIRQEREEERRRNGAAL